MGKKRKTRNQKIVSRLRRQLAQQAQTSNIGHDPNHTPTYSFSVTSKKKATDQQTEKLISDLSQEPNKKITTASVTAETETKKADNTILSYDLKLIKKDILKTVALSILIVATELVLYLKLG